MWTRQEQAALHQAATFQPFGNRHLQSCGVSVMGSHFIITHVRRMHLEEAALHESAP